MSLSKVSASVFTGVAESTVALANIHLDFALVKFNAPDEYKPLGVALSPHRREIAEDGVHHKTARSLAALFDRILPECPNLIRAYGKRSSEISNDVQQQEQDTSLGAFSGHLGVDATSIWAAATSGPAVIYVHLLACILARSWPGPEAVAIWVEIVEERKRAILAELNEGVRRVPLESLVAARQDISRSDISHWDASARAWLQIADNSQVKRQKQLMLILNNLDLSMSQKVTTFDSVIDVWKTSMLAMEKLITGQPQWASNGATLVGLACWHLFPDMIVLGDETKEVKFGDALVSPCGLLTIGVQPVHLSEAKGVYWSLSLAHLRYYGDPVAVTSSSPQDYSRLSMDEFQYIVFGSAISGWGRMPAIIDQAAIFFANIHQELLRNENAASSPGLELPTAADFPPGFVILLNIATRFLNLKDDEKATAKNLIVLGARKAENLLSRRPHRPPPFFGLLDPYVLATVRTPQNFRGVETEVGMLRYIASALGLAPSECIISMRGNKRGLRVIYMTAVHFAGCEPRGTFGDTEHIRWLVADSFNGATLRSGCFCHSRGHSCHQAQCPCMQSQVACTMQCHTTNKHLRKGCAGCCRPSDKAAVPERFASDECANCPDFDDKIYVSPNEAIFKSVALAEDLDFKPLNIGVTRGSKRHQPCANVVLQKLPRQKDLCSCFQRINNQFDLLAGDANTVALFMRPGRHTTVDDLSQRLSQAKQDAKAIDATHLLELLAGGDPKEVRKCCGEVQHGDEKVQETTLMTNIIKYVRMVLQRATIRIPTLADDLHVAHIDISLYLLSLNAVHYASDVYASLRGASVAMKLSSFQLHDSNWLPHSRKTLHLGSGCRSIVLNRQQKLACIAMFESGAYNIVPSDLDDVMAISYRNSIFIARSLLCDPFLMANKEEISLVVGNIGRAGMALLVAPQAPRIREPELEQYHQISHAAFDGELVGMFEATSLHLSFTEYEMPFDVGNRGGIDNDLCFVEALISVLDRGKWVADLDVLALYRDAQSNLARDLIVEGQKCGHSASDVPVELLALDNWEELLDLPSGLGSTTVGVVRASSNWMARVAATCIGIQRGLRTVVLPIDAKNQMCWTCLLKRHQMLKSKVPAHTSLDLPNADEGDEDDDYDDDGAASNTGSADTVLAYNDYYDDDAHVMTIPHLLIC